MNDQMIPTGITPEEAKKAREWALHALNKPGASTTAEKAVARVILNAVPTPPRPTLADMTEEERDECRWMQCDVQGQGGAWLIVAPFDDDDEDYAHVVGRQGSKSWGFPAECVTPRPDLPRMEWTSDTSTGPGHLAVGTVIESADDPRVAALPDGSVLRDCDGENVAKRHGEWVGIGYIPIPYEGDTFGQWTVLHIQKEDDQ